MIIICLISFLCTLRIGLSRLPYCLRERILPAFKSIYPKAGDTHSLMFESASMSAIWFPGTRWNSGANHLPADFRSTDNPWWHVKPYHCLPQGFWPPHSDHTWVLYLPGAPFTCIIQHRQLGVAKPWPLLLIVHITGRLGRVSHSVPQVSSFYGELAVNSSYYFFFRKTARGLRQLRNQGIWYMVGEGVGVLKENSLQIALSKQIIFRLEKLEAQRGTFAWLNPLINSKNLLAIKHQSIDWL